MAIHAYPCLADPFAGIAEHPHPGRILLPTRMPGMLGRAKPTLRVRHEYGETPVRSGHPRNTLRGTTGIERIDFSGLAAVIHEAQ